MQTRLALQSESSACLCLSVISLRGLCHLAWWEHSVYSGHHYRYIVLSFTSSVPTPTPVGSYQCACFTDGKTQRESQAPHLHCQPCWEHINHLLLSDQAAERILLGLGVQLTVSFLHLGFALSTKEKVKPVILSFILKTKLNYPNILLTKQFNFIVIVNLPIIVLILPGT